MLYTHFACLFIHFSNTIFCQNLVSSRSTNIAQICNILHSHSPICIKRVLYTAVTPDWRPYRVLNCHILENADGRIENANDFSKINPDFESAVTPEFCALRSVYVHGVPNTTLPRSYCVLGVSIEFTRRHCGVHTAISGDPTATPLRS